MAKYHIVPFVTFAETSKGSIHGMLRMQGDSVTSYDVQIARVDRAKKVIHYNAKSYSRTTKTHQGAVWMAFELHLKAKGWTLKEIPADSVPLWGVAPKRKSNR